jgi:predicted DNA-binding transcriptional regulator YafY
MTKTARVYRIEMLIKARGHVSFRELLDELEVSPATLKRDLEYLRDQLGAPIEYDRLLNGYKFGAAFRGQKHELPGLWFNERELYSLLMTHQLLSELDGQGTLSRHLQPLLERVHEMLGTSEVDANAIVKRVKIISPARREVPAAMFELVGEALVKRRRVHMRYFSRSRDDVGEREISPQRLVHYRGTWYVDAWCHRAEGLRRFALDAIGSARLLGARAREVAMKTVEAEMDAGYGIYAGSDLQWARLVFTPKAARWVSQEQWHPAQRGQLLADGSYEMEVPYSSPTELVMDLLRFGPDVSVVAPTALARDVAARHREAATAMGA